MTLCLRPAIGDAVWVSRRRRVLAKGFELVSLSRLLTFCTFLVDRDCPLRRLQSASYSERLIAGETVRNSAFRLCEISYLLFRCFQLFAFPTFNTSHRASIAFHALQVSRTRLSPPFGLGEIYAETSHHHLTYQSPSPLRKLLTAEAPDALFRIIQEG